jgi:hypothetical protein
MAGDIFKTDKRSRIVRREVVEDIPMLIWRRGTRRTSEEAFIMAQFNFQEASN